MSRLNPFAMHYQLPWEERSGDPTLPHWLRVVCLAYGKHRANGHAPFRPGAIALVLATADEVTGVIRIPDKRNVQRAIATAVKHGFLDGSSGSLCLVVPAHAVRGGVGGAENDYCPHHTRKGPRVHHSVTHSVPASTSLSDTRVHQILTPCELVTCADADALYDSSSGLPEMVTR